MKYRKYIYLFYAVCLCMRANLLAQDPELLKTSDIHTLMQQIFQQHYGQKNMTGQVMQHALRTYIDQFDPNRIYLLKSEVEPYLHPSDSETSKDVSRYLEGNYTEFQQLNDVIQKAIVRARDIRAQLLKNPSQFFSKDSLKNAKPIDEWQDPNLKLPFAANKEELTNRIKQNFQEFVSEEIDRFGDAKINKYQGKTLAIYDRYLRSQEDSYLYTNEKGQPLPEAQKENLFSFHVLKALANALDAHTTFYNNTQARDLRMILEKEFQGVGIVLEQTSDGSVVIKQLLEGGPADKSGLVKPGDIIISVDGKSVSNLPLEKVMELIRGKNGTPVELVLQRQTEENGKVANKQINVKLTRAEITLNDERAKSTFVKYDDGIIGIITLNSFYHGDNGVNAASDVQADIEKLKHEGNLKGLILDLRNNSGGFLNQAVAVASLFINNGVVVVSKYSDGSEHFYRDMQGDRAYNGPLLILTSKGTASAAEIVSQALQDYGVAIVVGDERTYGKGSIQSQTVTDNNAPVFFKVTVGKYYTVSGKTPQITGVKADIVVPGKFTDEHIGEKYLENALPNDRITPEYKDKLKDVDSSLKPWYMRYYYPTIQQRVETWRALLPVLKEKSAARLGNNKQYQLFLNELKEGTYVPPSESAEKDKKNTGISKLQLDEAVNIMKDMVMLQSQEHPVPVAQQNSNFGQTEPTQGN